MLSLDSFQNSDTGQAARWGQIIQQYHDSAVQANLPAKPKHDKLEMTADASVNIIFDTGRAAR